MGIKHYGHSFFLKLVWWEADGETETSETIKTLLHKVTAGGSHVVYVRLFHMYPVWVSSLSVCSKETKYNLTCWTQQQQLCLNLVVIVRWTILFAKCRDAMWRFSNSTWCCLLGLLSSNPVKCTMGQWGFLLADMAKRWWFIAPDLEQSVNLWTETFHCRIKSHWSDSSWHFLFNKPLNCSKKVWRWVHPYTENWTHHCFVTVLVLQ